MGEMFFNTNEVAQMLQVDKSTIKRWTDEGKIKCFRTPGGHRKFRADDVYNFMSTFNYGVSTLQVLPQLASDEVIIKKIVEKKEFNVLSSVCFNAALKGKKDEALTLFIEIYRTGLSLSSIFDNILRPTLKKINVTFASHKISPIEYQLAHNVLSFAVVQLGDNVQRMAKNNRTIICASMTSEKNDVEMNALVTLFEMEGYSVMNLGHGVDADSINNFIYRTKPYAVCLCASTTNNDNVFAREIERILHATKDNMSRLIVGGDAFNATTILDNFVGINNCSTFNDFSLLTLQESEQNINN